MGQLNVSAIQNEHEDELRGYPPYHTRMTLKVLIYGYCVGVRSSRKIARRFSATPTQGTQLWMLESLQRSRVASKTTTERTAGESTALVLSPTQFVILLGCSNRVERRSRKTSETAAIFLAENARLPLNGFRINTLDLAAIRKPERSPLWYFGCAPLSAGRRIINGAVEPVLRSGIRIQNISSRWTSRMPCSLAVF